MVDRFAADWHSADLDAPTVALLEHAEKLTISPSSCNEKDIEALRAAGWSDRAITDAVQVCAYFNYINRIAEGLGVDDEEWLGSDGQPV
ncbi:MAG: peroxidase [Acidimicrobiia bacterium]